MKKATFLVIITFLALSINAQKLHKVKLKTWLFGPLLTKIKLARFANYFAMMYNSGITVLDALKISEDMVDNMILEESISQARNSISDGVIISKGQSRSTFLPQVWDQLPRTEDFLAHLCKKAGLSPDEWTKGELAVSIYQVQYFHEN